ncbi:MAG TPA: glycosyltransferase family A protein [Pyrinomonadaceae bacterium]|nr:glycosyltransferase family A protein [Pyrinomonadaceae bacterium]
MKTQPLLTVVVPVYNGGPQLERCLDALLASDFPDYEIVVVDDGSTDESASLARARGVSVLQLDSQSGPAAARNLGASHALGSLILFVDADVVVRRETLSRLIAHFSVEGVAAVFGSYDDAPAAAGFVSQYKNLQHHFVHQQASAEAETFWAGCGAIRRKAFAAVGGFDESKYKNPSIEDIELGYRLRRKDFKIILDRELQVTHLKRWTLHSLLRTDIFRRALPWSRLILENEGMINDLNLRVADRVCVVLTGLALAFLMLAYFSILFLPLMLAALAGVLLLNHRFFSFLKSRRGQWFALRSFPLLALYYFYSGTVFAFCYCAHVLRNVFGGTRLGQQSSEPGRVKDAS